MPLYDPLTFYQRLMGVERSHVAACYESYWLSVPIWKPAMEVRWAVLCCAVPCCTTLCCRAVAWRVLLRRALLAKAGDTQAEQPLPLAPRSRADAASQERTRAEKQPMV